MAYEAVPDDVEIQKLTSAQRDALSRYKIHENINTILANENTPLLIGAGVLAFALPTLTNMVLQAQEDALNITLTDKQKETLLTSPVLGPVGIANLLARKAVSSIADLEFPKDLKFGKGVA